MFKIYDNNNALPQNTVFCIYQDHLGFLWVGTEEGVCRFDGHSWQLFNVNNGLINTHVRCIGQDLANRFWLGTMSSIWCLDLTSEGAHWQDFTPEWLADDFFYCFYRDHLGRVWFGAHRGAYCLDLTVEPPVWRSYLTGHSSEVQAITQDSRQRYWFATKQGAKVLDFSNENESWQTFAFPGMLEPQTVISLYIDSFEHVWLGTANQGVGCLDLARACPAWEIYTTLDGLAANYVNSILEDSSGQIWFGTGDGISCLDKTKTIWRNYTTAQGLPHNHISYVYEDKAKRLWFGTDGGGVACLDNSFYSRLWKTYRSQDGLVGNNVISLTQDATGQLWVGTRSGLSVLKETGDEVSWENFTVENGLPHNLVWALFADKWGGIWAGTRYGLAYQKNGQGWETFTTADGLVDNQVDFITQDKQNRLWFSTFGGISILTFRDGVPHWETFSEAAKLSRTIHRHIYQDTAGYLWFATARGVFNFDPATPEKGWNSLTTEDGLAENQLKCIYQDSRQHFWFGTQGGGLCRYNPSDGSWITYNTANGLSNNIIYAILEDDRGFIWVPTNRGVCRVNPITHTIITFDHWAGLANDECNVLAAYKDKRGRLWFGTVNGLSVADPAALPATIPPCRVYLNNLKVMGREQRLEKGLVLETSDYELIFEYGAVEFTAPEQLRYRYRLVGLEKEWSAPTTSRSIRYTLLPPGPYTFMVQAKNWGGEWSEVAAYDFVVIQNREELRREAERQAAKAALLRVQIEKQVLEAHNSELKALNTELQRLNLELQKLNSELERQAREDGLTGVLNRRYLELELNHELARAVRYNRPLSLVMVDVDYFKKINDNFSHQIGDRVLKVLANILSQNCRATDIIGRYGGEEFVLVLPETELESTVASCERIRTLIADYSWDSLALGLKVTVSMGAVEKTQLTNYEELLRLADEYLYQAKHNGRNQLRFPVVLA